MVHQQRQLFKLLFFINVFLNCLKQKLNDLVLTCTACPAFDANRHILEKA